MIVDFLPEAVAWLPEEKDFFRGLEREFRGSRLPFSDPDLYLVEDVLEDLRQIGCESRLFWEPRTMTARNGIETEWSRDPDPLAVVAFYSIGNPRGGGLEVRLRGGRTRLLEPRDGDVLLVDPRGLHRWVSPEEGPGFRGAVILR